MMERERWKRIDGLYHPPRQRPPCEQAAFLQEARAGDTPSAIFASVIKEDPKPPSEWIRGIPPDLERVIHRCLRENPAQR